MPTAVARTLMRHARPRSSIVCLSSNGILCSTQAIRTGSTTQLSLSQPRNTNLTEPFAIDLIVCLAPIVLFADAKWAMSMVTSSPYETMLRAHLPSKHYVSISITKTHVKGFFTLKAAISLYLICTLIRVYHFNELHVVYTFFYAIID